MKEKERPARVRVRIADSHVYWVGDQRFNAGEELEVLEKDYKESPSLFQLVETGKKKAGDKSLKINKTKTKETE